VSDHDLHHRLFLKNESDQTKKPQLGGPRMLKKCRNWTPEASHPSAEGNQDVGSHPGPFVYSISA
jgi:hypothetical protein